MTAPQPSRKARVMTLRFVTVGPEPITNGFGSFNPSTVVVSVAMTNSFICEARLLTDYAREFDRKMSGQGLLDPAHRLVGELIESSDRQLKMFFLRVLDFVVTDAVQALDKHHHGRYSRA